MVFLNESGTALKSIVNSINTTTSSWRLGPLSSEWVFVNGSMPNNTWVYGYFYNGSVASINDTVIIQRKEHTTVGFLSLGAFVYLMISIVVIIALFTLPNCADIVGMLIGDDRRFNTTGSATTMTEYAFAGELRRFYPPEPPDPPLPSYAETVPWVPGSNVPSSEIRDCQSMIRKIYALKVDAFNGRDAHEFNQPTVRTWKKQANAGLADVQAAVDRWSQGQNWSVEERAKVDEIRQRILNIRPDPVENHGIAEVEDHGIAKVEDHGIAKVEDHGIAKVEDHSIAEVEGHGIAEVEDHGIAEVEGHGIAEVNNW